MAQSTLSAQRTTTLPRTEQAVPVSPTFHRLWWIMSVPLFIFLLLPLAALLFSTSPIALITSVNQPFIIQAVAISLMTTFCSTLVIIILGTPVAYLLARRQVPFRRLIDTLLDLPIVLPPAVAGIALLMTFGRQGLLGPVLDELNIHIAFTPIAVMLAQTFIAAPFFIKSATIGFANIDTELEQAASLDGADGWQLFRFLTIPLAWSALLSGAVMSWARALGEFGATIIFAGNFVGRTQTMPLAIYMGFELDLNIALILSVILMAFSFLALFIVKVLLQRQQV
jgi:molybdate transport system permease protein